MSTARELNRGSVFVPLLLGAACVASGVAVVQVQHHSREVTAGLNHQRQLHDKLYLHYEQLRLEQATLGSHPRVQRIAHEQLDMVEPRDYIIVVPQVDGHRGGW
ncbi:MAG: cell division protein FtsL [Sinobacteraceae bacterium]|nr:cell division protein FtsL [Nevskiaceae bacterium]